MQQFLLTQIWRGVSQKSDTFFFFLLALFFFAATIVAFSLQKEVSMNVANVFAEMMATLPARRGSVHEQFLTKHNSKGELVKHGPYYVYTRYVEGKTVSQRISKEEYAKISEEIERGKRLSALIERLWHISEKMAANSDGKKKRHLPKLSQRQPS